MNQPIITINERAFHVSQALANHAIEGFHPDAADKQILARYIAGTASIKDLLSRARKFAQDARKGLSA